MADIDALAAVVSDSERSRRERVAAFKELAQSSDSGAIAHLQKALLGGDETWAARSAAALGNMGATEAVPALIGVLRTHGGKNVRSCAALALGKIGDPTAADALLEATSDRVEAVRTTARSALKKMERAAAAKVKANPEQIDEQLKTLAAGRLDRWGFNLPFVLAGLVVAGAVSYWNGALGTALPVLIGVAVFVVAVNLVQGRRKNRRS